MVFIKGNFRIVFVLFILCGAFLRLYGLSLADYTNNESGFMVRSYGLGYGEYLYEEPSFAASFLSMSMDIFGFNAFALRIPGAIFGILTIVLIYYFAKMLKGSDAGLIAASFWATSWYLVFISRTAEFDNLFVLLAVAMMYLYVRGLKDEKYLMGAALVAGLMLGTKLSAVSVIGIMVLHFAYVVYSRGYRISCRSVGRMHIYCVILFFVGVIIASPYWVLDFVPVDSDSPTLGNVYVPYGIKEAALSMRKNLGGYYIQTYFDGGIKLELPKWYWLYRMPILFTPMILLFFVFGVAYPLKRKNEENLLLLMWFLMLFAFFSMSKTKIDYYVLPLVPPLFILASMALVEMKEKLKYGRLVMPLVMLLVTCNLYLSVSFFPHYPVANDGFTGEAGEAGLYLQEKVKENDVVMGYPSVRVYPYISQKNASVVWRRYIYRIDTFKDDLDYIQSGNVTYFVVHRSQLRTGITNPLVDFVMDNYEPEKVIYRDGEEAFMIYRIYEAGGHTDNFL